MTTKPTAYKVSPRKGMQNRAAIMLRLSLNNLKFDGVKEWVKAYRELEGLLAESTNKKEVLTLLNIKFDRLEKMFGHIYPKLKEIEVTNTDLIEMEAEGVKTISVEDQSTDDLLKAIDVTERQT